MRWLRLGLTVTAAAGRAVAKKVLFVRTALGGRSSKPVAPDKHADPLFRHWNQSLDVEEEQWSEMFPNVETAYIVKACE